MTFRARLIIYYSSLLVGVLFLFGAAVFTTLRWTMLNQVDATLDRVTEGVLDETRGIIETGPDGEPQITTYVPRLDTFRTPGVFVQIWEPGETPVLVSASENLGTYREPLDVRALRQGKQGHSRVTINGVHLRVRTRPIEVQGQVIAYVQAASSLYPVEAALDRLIKILLGGGSIALLISLLVGDVLARHILRPISSVAATARSIAQTGDLGRRIPYTGPQDELGSMVTTFNDTLARLQKIFESQRRFIADVSHEFRSPLTTIRGNLDLIRRYGNNPESLDAIQDEVQRMSLIVSDMLTLAQADAGQIPLNFRRFSLEQLLLEIYDYAVSLANGKHQLKIGKLDEVIIRGDSDQLRQLFLQILSNAIRYTPEGGLIEISLTHDSRHAFVKISDNGIGIPAEDLPHIFDRFYRVDKARARVAGGTGLGLSIAQWIAEAHSGRITVSSTVGEGTTFTVILPIPADLARTEIAGTSADNLPKAM